MTTGYRILFAALFITLMSSASWGANISGTIFNNSSSSGRVYVFVEGQYGSSGFGTSLASPAPGSSVPFTIKGLPPSGENGYRIYGFIDTRGNGSPYASSPIGWRADDAPFVVVNSDVSNIDVSFYNQTRDIDDLPYPSQPVEIVAVPGNNSALLFWNTPKNNSFQVEIADHYNLYWGTDPLVGQGNTPGGGSTTVISSIDANYLVSGLTTGSYYFGVEAVFNGTKSAIRRSGEVAIGVDPPGGSKTVSGTISIKDSTGNSYPTNKAMFVALTAGKGPAYFTYLAGGTPASSRPFSIPGVAPGQYELFAFVDDGDNRKGPGDWSTPEADFLTQKIEVQADMSGLSVEVVAQDVQKMLTTNRGFDGIGGTSYTLDFRFDAAGKLPAKVEISGSHGIPDLTMGINPNETGKISINYPVTAPKVGDSYSGVVTFADGLTEDFTLKVTGVMSNMPVVSFPSNDSGPDSVQPTFSWRMMNPPAGDYRYHVTLNSNNGGDWLMDEWVDANHLSVPYGGNPLAFNSSYNWNVSVVDSFGNSAQAGQMFTPRATGPTVTSVSPATLACNSTAPITITGTGFSTTPANNHVYFNNFNQAFINSASATQLVVQLPGCGGNAVSTGPVSVRVDGTNNIAAASATNFVPTISYSYGVTDSSGTAVTGATVQVTDSIPPVVTNTNDTGQFTLNGIPAGLPFSLKITYPSALPVYSHNIVQGGNFSKTGAFAMYSQTQLDTWNGAAGKGAIKSHASDSGTNLGGVAVTAFSTLHGSSTYYAVAYKDDSNNFCPAPSCTATAGTGSGAGVYYVLNVEEGDTVIVSAAKAGYSFPARTFKTHAGAVSEGQLPGTPIPTISSLSATSGVVGSTISINGTNFSTTGGNSVVFSGNHPATVTSASSTRLDVTVPPSAQSGPITVTVNGIPVTSPTFSVPAPTITSFSPTQGPPGTQITITGTNFSLGPNPSQSLFDNRVTINSNFANVQSSSATELIVSAPPVSGTNNIQVQTSGGTIQSGTSFTVLDWPIYGFLVNANATPGSSATIGSATYYDLDMTKYQVTIGGNNIPAAVTSVTANSLVFTVPAGAQSGGGVIVTYYGQQSYVGNLTIQYPLAVTISGAGTINKMSPDGAITCGTNSCTGNFSYNTFVSLHATASSGYQFQGWSGDCGTNGDCSVNMVTGKAVIATFNPLLYIKNGSNSYSLLQTAFDEAANLDNILAQAQVFTINNLIFDRSGLVVKLKGGYDGSFAANNGTFSTISGKLSIRGGTLQVENIKIM